MGKLKYILGKRVLPPSPPKLVRLPWPFAQDNQNMHRTT